MLALVANATQETDAGIVAALVGFWLWRHHRLGRTVRKAARAVVCVAAVVVAAWVSPVLCVLAVGGVIGVWAAKRHPRRRRRARSAGRVLQMTHKILNKRARGTFWHPRTAALGAPTPYHQWMASSGWRRQRNAALARAHYRCEVRGCASGRHAILEVHHNNNEVYGHLAAARPSDLTVLCVQHHGAITHLHRHRGYTIAQATRMVMTAEMSVA